MKKIADRYTVIKTSPADLAKHIINARSLGLHWFVKGDSDRSGNLSLYLFFDEMGMNAYLSGDYAETTGTTDPNHAELPY